MPEQLGQKHRDLADRLSKPQGGEFDHEYAKAMVEGHEGAVRLLQDRAAGTKAVGTSGDAQQTECGKQALTQWAAKTLPIVQRHLERARTAEHGEVGRRAQRLVSFDG